MISKLNYASWSSMPFSAPSGLSNYIWFFVQTLDSLFFLSFLIWIQGEDIQEYTKKVKSDAIDQLHQCLTHPQIGSPYPCAPQAINPWLSPINWTVYRSWVEKQQAITSHLIQSTMIEQGSRWVFELFIKLCQYVWAWLILIHFYQSQSCLIWRGSCPRNSWKVLDFLSRFFQAGFPGKTEFFKLSRRKKYFPFFNFLFKSPPKNFQVQLLLNSSNIIGFLKC